MPVTIKVNGVVNSLVHKGSNGVSIATLPDVCKTPSPGGPVPIPYPNISQSATLDKGTSTVKADGGMMIAVKGSEYALSNGDNPGVAGGVKSGTFMKESTWILYSFDVKMEGKNACRLTDKKFQNHENTVDLAGNLQVPVGVAPKPLQKIANCCNKAVDCKSRNKGANCTKRGTHKHKCCEDAINRRKAKGKWENVQAEKFYPAKRGHDASRLDVQITNSKGRVTHILDFKFNCDRRPYMSDTQLQKYKDRFPGRKIKVIGARGKYRRWPAERKEAHCVGAKTRDTC
ncbi:DUF4150 domain-containing protein [Pseudoduganella namucuonensis]|uniref:Uncharacterized protein n=1 Tax=Pseudoduganella namucuonensis TaxID=1035707 RepID=A0A1I7KPT8_9BURK|nr:DUF4150 domain-containing protein [Pseudoduganella namucuonensis]SFU99448.1 protein of unknown function [Pseudoduganella namucuonensis]